MKSSSLKWFLVVITTAILGCEISPEISNHFELRLQSNIVAVVSEGGLEPRSIGSYSLRVYEVIEAQHPYDNYVTGVLVPRDGTIESLVGEDINGDGVREIVVITKVAGSGAYISAIAYEYKNKKLNSIASVHDRLPDENIIKSLVSIYNQASNK